MTMPEPSNPVGTEVAVTMIREALTNYISKREDNLFLVSASVRKVALEALTSLQAELSRCREERDKALHEGEDAIKGWAEGFDRQAQRADAAEAELSRCREEMRATNFARNQAIDKATSNGDNWQAAEQQLNEVEAQRDALEKVALTTSALHRENERLRAALTKFANWSYEPNSGDIRTIARNALSQEGTE